jgi:hypothetical protein
MVRIRSVGVISCAKIYAILHMAIGVVVALVLVLVGVVGLAAAPGQQKFGMIGVIIIAGLSPFLYGAIGFVMGAIGALLYNWIASAVGGLQMELDTVPMQNPVPPQPPQPNPAS